MEQMLSVVHNAGLRLSAAQNLGTHQYVCRMREDDAECV